MPDADTKPTPDPTILTTEQLLREIGNATALLESQVEGVRGVFHEKFNSIENQFQLVERQRVEQKTDTATAVSAALSAAKEAVKEQTDASDKSITKSETATSEQLKQLTNTFITALDGLGKVLDDLKDRVGKIESRKEGASENRAVVLSIASIAVVIIVAYISTKGFTK